MAKKKQIKHSTFEEMVPAPSTPQPITETIEKNYMPYVMSVIISRAIPEIDGFKPAHRKLLYTMYTMGLMTGQRTKSANIVGQTMHLNPHGDASIYETMVRLTRGHAALLHPFIDSKGSFGKQYSRDMAYAASRYTEAKLDPICKEIFNGIDKNAVDMVPNYDNTTTEPTLLPTSFPNILVSSNMGIAVGMASQICSFNLEEICKGTIAILKNPKTTTDELLEIIKAPDFPGGAQLIYDREKMKNLFETGRESLTLRSKYEFDSKNNCIEIKEIPYSTSIELILKKLTDMIKDGSLKEVTDVRDEIDLHGFQLALDIKRGVDPDILMSKLFKKTPLQDEFACNFNVLIDGEPKTLGVKALLEEWIRFRMGCLRRELTFDLEKKSRLLHLLLGLGKILLDIDKAIKIVRETEKDSEVVPNLMKGFEIDQLQAEYIAEIKLRHLNREYILDRISEIKQLQEDIKDLRETIDSDNRVKKLIVKQLEDIVKKYAIPRKTEIVYEDNAVEFNESNFVENYNVKLYLTKDGFFKKITLVSLRGSDVQMVKEGDEITMTEDAENITEVMFVGSNCQMYRCKASEFDSVKASQLGEYVPAKLGFDENEHVVTMIVGPRYDSNDKLIFIFENGKGVKVPINLYKTTSNRKKLVGSFSKTSPIVACFLEKEKTNLDILMVSSDKKGILISSKLIPEKSTRTAAGSTLYKVKTNHKVVSAVIFDESMKKGSGCRKIKIPATGSSL